MDPQTYAEYVRLLREEYSHIPMEEYLRGRLTIVSRLLEREHLFHSPLGERWERAARENLSAEQRRLKEKLAKLAAEQSRPEPQGDQDVPETLTASTSARSFPGTHRPSLRPQESDRHPSDSATSPEAIPELLRWACAR